MSDYRIYFQDANGHVGRPWPLQCGRDEEAVAAAHELEHRYPVEVWHLDRFVRLVEPTRRRPDVRLVETPRPAAQVKRHGPVPTPEENYANAVAVLKRLGLSEAQIKAFRRSTPSDQEV